MTQEDGEKFVVVRRIRKCLSVAVVHVNGTCLIDRLHQVRSRVASANGRSAAAQSKEEMIKQHRISEWAARIGRKTLSRGSFFL